MPIWQPFSQPGMVLFPRWTQLWTGSPLLSPPQEFTRQQPKIFDRPRSQDNTPGRQFSLKLTTVRFSKKSEMHLKKNQSTSRYVTVYKNPKYHPRCFTNKSEIKSEVKIRNTSQIYQKYTFRAVSRKIWNFFYRSFPPDIQFHGL